MDRSSLPAELAKRLVRLDEGKAILDGLRPLPGEVVEELRHRFEVRLTHHSTAIEGNTLTQSEAQIVLEKGITIAGKPLREHLEVVGHKEALDFVRELVDRREPVGERQIREIHSLVMKGQEGSDHGAYRNLNVKAAGTEFAYPDHLRVPELMATFTADLTLQLEDHPVVRASEAHRHFVTIHPFRDGNGRVGRLLMNLLLLGSGYPIATLPVERRAEYIDALDAAQQRQNDALAEELLSLVLDAVESSLRETLEAAVGSAEVTARTPSPADQIAAWIGY